MDDSTPGSTSGNPDDKGNKKCNHTGDEDNINALPMEGGSDRIREELPFLVTHWLANYKQRESDDSSENCYDQEAKHREHAAIANIRRATSELASAFASIGAYGTTFRVSGLLWVALHLWIVTLLHSVRFNFMPYISLFCSVLFYSNHSFFWFFIFSYISFLACVFLSLMIFLSEYSATTEQNSRR